MNSVSLWLEISISGFFYLLPISFFTLKFLGIKDIAFMANIKDFETLVSVGVAITSYLLGILAHRLLPVLFLKPLSFIMNKVKRKQLLRDKDYAARHNANLVKVWQYGSARIHKELDFQFSLNALLRSLMVGIPLSGISIAFWAQGTAFQDLATPILFSSLVLGALFFVANERQRARLKEIEQAAFEEMKTVSRNK